ncbi:MAG: ribonuclease III domain-containing protein [Peptostreptococcaceae bacterium]|nr:ribonuclease III domain-containing protein [Peptostreptococcaceae bacterium]MDY5738726.1 ribonuclease III domain-containing protein [Anaerovoracaceae bacterium]
MNNLKDKEINTTALAYIGDAVYEVYIRGHMLKTRGFNVDALHKKAIDYVSATGQAKAMKALLKANFLSDEEKILCRRAKNRKIISKPRYVEPMVYKNATAFEALIGKLYLDEMMSRLEEVVDFAIKTVEEKNE